MFFSSKLYTLPHNKKGYFSKKMQYYNNSVGYASKEQGGNLIIKEQWLEDPCWYIVVLLDNEEANKLAKAIINFLGIYKNLYQYHQLLQNLP